MSEILIGRCGRTQEGQIRINKKSDFPLTLKLVKDGNFIKWYDCDFDIKAFVEDGFTTYTAGRSEGVFNHCRVEEDGTLTLFFDNHKLPIGELQIEVVFHHPDSDYGIDGVRQEAFTVATNILLVNDNGNALSLSIPEPKVVEKVVEKEVEKVVEVEVSRKENVNVFNVLGFDGFVESANNIEAETATANYTILFDKQNKRFVALHEGSYSANWHIEQLDITDEIYQTQGENPQPYANKIYIDKTNSVMYYWDRNTLSPLKVKPEDSAIDVSNLSTEITRIKERLVALENRREESGNANTGGQNTSTANTKANYVKIEESLNPTFVKGGFIDNKNSVVNYANTSYCKDLSVKGFDLIKTNAGWFSNARTLLLDDNGRVLKDVTYSNENGNSTSEKIIDLTEFPNVAKISISTGHDNTYVIGVKTTKKLIQDYLLEHDLSKISKLEDELKPLTIFTRSEGFYNDSLVWNSATNKFSVKHTDVSLLKVGEGMKFNYKGFALGSAVNYAFFDESKNKVSSIVGKDLRAGVEVVIPAGVKYVFFQSFSTEINPESVVFSLVTKDWFRPYIESLVDVKALNMLKASNILWGKKYVAIGDSFTDAIGTEKIAEDGVFKGSPKVYPYIIGNHNNMGVLNQGASGTTLNQYIVNRKFESIPNDVDYITIWFGINDKGHGIQIGTSTDKVEVWSNEKAGSTGAAFNYIFEWIFTNRPFAHVGVIVTDFAEQERRNVIIECCKRWGVAFLDLYSPTVPMIRTRGEQIELDPKIKEIRDKQFSLNGVKDMHPNNKAHQWQSTIIENFMRSL
jgi:hypothetical protein|nr:MAG TPA: GDSL like Lipase Acylhydrolase [Caudoviricetes sp.]